MKVRATIQDARKYYSNDDEILVEVRVTRDGEDSPDVASDVRRVNVTLECEGVVVGSDKQTSRFSYFKSPNGRLEVVSERPEAVTYRSVLRFPPEGALPPSSLHFDDVKDGIEWFVCAQVVAGSGAVVPSKQSCTFMQSGPLPHLLSLIDTEHVETVEGIEVDLITTHATAGLPQSPLSAGIGFCIETSRDNALALKRLRLLLLDTTEVNIGDQHKFLPPHRWLLSSTSFKPAIPLRRHTSLDEYTRDVQIDHATLPESFECDEFAHCFDLAVEVTLVSTAKQHKARKIVSMGPVTVLPRIGQAGNMDALDRTTSHASDIAYITDSSDDEDEDGGDNEEERVVRYQQHVAIPKLDVSQDPPILAHSHSSVGSAESVRSVFSDHSKLDLNPEIALHSLSFS